MTEAKKVIIKRGLKNRIFGCFYFFKSLCGKSRATGKKTQSERTRHWSLQSPASPFRTDQ